MVSLNEVYAYHNSVTFVNYLLDYKYKLVLIAAATLRKM